MRIPMPAISDPLTFIYDQDNPTLYTEGLSHALHLILFTLSEAGAELDDGSPSYMSISIDRDRDFDTIQLHASIESMEEEL